MFHVQSLEPKFPSQPKTKVFSVGTFLPSNVVKSDHLFEDIKSEANYNIPIDWMSSQMGIVERRLADENALPSDLAIPAAEKAIELADIDRSEIDIVIFCGIERDQPEPATAHTIQHALGLKAHHAFDVANACFGFFDAMEIASNYIKTGVARYVLVCTGEVPSRVLRSFVRQLKRGVPMDQAKKMVGGLSVGDAGGAAILGHNYENTSGFDVFNTMVDSAHVQKCIYRVKDDGEIDGQMIMGDILARGHRLLRKLSNETLEKAGWDKYDWFVSHQPGKASVDFAKKMNVVEPENIIEVYQKLGNITSATFPIAFENLINNGMVSQGSRIGGWFAGSGITAGQFCYTY